MNRDFVELHLAISKLSEDLRILCNLLMEHKVCEVSRILGISRGSVRNKISKIRKEISKK